MFLSKKLTEYYLNNSSVNTGPQDSAARGVLRFILDLDGEMTRKADLHTGLLELFYLFRSISSRQISFSLAVTAVSPVDIDVVTEIVRESPPGQTPGLWVGCALFVGLAVLGGGCFLYNLITGGANDIPSIDAEIGIMSEFSARVAELTLKLQMAEEYKETLGRYNIDRLRQMLCYVYSESRGLGNFMADNPQHWDAMTHFIEAHVALHPSFSLRYAIVLAQAAWKYKSHIRSHIHNTEKILAPDSELLAKYTEVMSGRAESFLCRHGQRVEDAYEQVDPAAPALEPSGIETFFQNCWTSIRATY